MLDKSARLIENLFSFLNFFETYNKTSPEDTEYIKENYHLIVDTVDLLLEA
jgi:hypothetical protein